MVLVITIRIRYPEKKVGRTHELKGVRVRASTLKGCCARLFQGPQDSFKFVCEQKGHNVRIEFGAAMRRG